MKSLRTRFTAVAATGLLVASTLVACGTADTARNAAADNDQLLGASGCVANGAQCEDQDFRGKDLRGVTFESSVLNGARFDGANLDGATFRGTSLRGTSWQPPDSACRIPFTGAHAQCATDFGWATFDAPLQTIVSASYGATGTGAFAGDGGLVTSAKFSGPTGVAISDDSKTVYVSDSRNRRVRAIDVFSGKITTVAGSGRKCTFDIDRCGDGSAATTGDLSEPVGLAYDGAGKRLFIADQGASLIRAVDLNDNTISTLAGNGRLGYSGDGGPAEAARLAKPAGMAFADNKLYFADLANNSVRVIDLGTGDIERLAGSPAGKPCNESTPCGDNGAAANAKLDSPNDVAVSPTGEIAIADTRDRAIRLISTDGSIRSVVSGAKGSADSEDSEDPRPSLVEYDRDGNLYVGPLKSGKLGRLSAAQIASRNHLNWSVPVASTTGLGAGSLLSTEPANRFLVATDPASQQVRLIVSNVGPNLKNAKFVNATLGPRYSSPQGQIRSNLTGFINQNTTFENVNLDWAHIRDSSMPDLIGTAARKVTASNVRFGKLVRADLSYAHLQSVSGVAAESTCFRNVQLQGKLSSWSMSDSTLAGATVVDGTATFVDLRARNSSIGNTAAGGTLAFDKGELDQASFYNVAQAKPEIRFDQTRLRNVPAVSDDEEPDPNQYPQDWAETSTTGGCIQEPYSATADYSQQAQWGRYWGRNHNNPALHVWGNFTADDQGELRTGELKMDTVPDWGQIFITIQSEDGHKLLELPAANGTVDLTGQIKELHNKGTPLIVRPGSKLRFDIRSENSAFDPEVRGHHIGHSSDFPVPQGSNPLAGQVTVTGHLDGGGFGKSNVTVKVATDGSQRLSGITMTSDGKEKNLDMLVIDPVTKMSAPEDFRRGSLSQLTNGQKLDVRVWSVKDPGKVLKGSITMFDPNEPSPVDNVAATNLGNGVVRIAWQKRDDGRHAPENYVVTASPNGGKCTATGTASSCDISKLAPAGTDTTYTFTIQANRGGFHPEVGKTQLHVRDPNVPSPLLNFAALNTGGGVVDVSWQRPNDGGNAPENYVVTASPGGASCTVAGTASGCKLTGMNPPKGSSTKYTITAVGNRGKFHPEVGKTELLIESLTPEALQKERDAKIASLQAERDQKLAAVVIPASKPLIAAALAKAPNERFDTSEMFAEADREAIKVLMAENKISESAARTELDGWYAVTDRCGYPGWKTKTVREVLKMFYVDEPADSNCKFGDSLSALMFPMAFIGSVTGTPLALTQFGLLANEIVDARTAEANAEETREKITADYAAKIEAVRKDYDKRIADLKG